MNIDLSKPWKEVFALVAEAKAEERRKKLDHLIAEELDRQDREKHIATENREKEDKEEQAFEQMLATADRIADFSSRLDDLDTAAVKALMSNGEALERVQRQLGTMLDNADKLPDGRHVFKTEDGTRVFDEHGAELSPAVVDPHSINDVAPRWEPFKALQEKKHKIEAERHELLAFQEKLDQARARLDKGNVTNKDLDTLDADLKATMPPSIREILGRRGVEADGPRIAVQNPTEKDQPRVLPRLAALLGPSMN